LYQSLESTSGIPAENKIAARFAHLKITCI